jgi:hypothetical protein
MNERIYELALQAQMAANKGDSVDVKIMMAKFGAAIVRECIKITRPDTEYPNEGNDWEQGFHVGKEDAADHIKEHFGVEE